jgi:3-oxoacyl-[acyl-carrier protein] reductase
MPSSACGRRSLVNLPPPARGHCGSGAHAHYSASKGGASSLSKGLVPKTRVNIVAPRIIATHTTERLAHEKGRTPLDDTLVKRFGGAEEVVRVVAILCSELAAFATGRPST